MAVLPTVDELTWIVQLFDKMTPGRVINETMPRLTLAGHDIGPAFVVSDLSTAEEKIYPWYEFVLDQFLPSLRLPYPVYTEAVVAFVRPDCIGMSNTASLKDYLISLKNGQFYDV